VVFRCGDGVLLIFDPRKSRAAGREVPSHGASGAGTIAFTAKPEDLSAWRKQLHEAGVSIEQEMDWGVHPGADFASRPDQMVRLGLLFHVLFVSRLSPPAPAQVRQVGSNVGALIIARS
jgi:hypothetical protein